ncbi:ABC transporter permease [Microbacterium gorillae]|uniref:ABC transporter permease n=1 Tax=Microbacterium gorillae TaxID=1231063 RepID=UPI000AB00C72|nr:ABC transporter permease [Microbacterium gorillae]
MKWFRRRRSAADDETSPATGEDLVAPIPHADRFLFSDLAAEATADIGSRPGRLVMTTVGTVLGIGALVATIGFAQTTAGQISSQFDAVAATTVVVQPQEAKAGREGKLAATGRLPWDSPDRVERLVGVEDSALIGEVDLGGQDITAVPVVDPSAVQKAPPDLIGATPGLLHTLRGEIVTGRMFDSGHLTRADRVAVLGAGAAEQLGVSRLDTQPAIFIAGVPYAVIGIVDGFARRAELTDSVIIPMSAAQADFALPAPSQLQIRIGVGAGPQVARQAVIALAPDAPEGLKANSPPKRSDLAQDVQADVNFVFIVLGAIVLLAGALGIANVTMLNVSERVGEIGLRRALGATRRQIGSQFVLESIVIGLLGGLIGSAVGVFAIVGVSLVRGWSPIISPWVALAGAVLGAVVGLAAGWFPARRAARIEPVTALRGG